MGPEISKLRGTRRFPVSVFAIEFPVSSRSPRSTAVEKSISIVHVPNGYLRIIDDEGGRTTSAVLNMRNGCPPYKFLAVMADDKLRREW